MKEVFGSILKLAAFLLILPLIIASCIAFQTQILSLPVNKEAWLLWGAAIYIAFNLFIYDFKNVHEFGNSLLEKMVPFFKPARFIIPIYTVILILLNVLAWLVGQGESLQPYFLFAIAFTLTMHLVLTAHALYESDKSILKAHYLLVFGTILIASFFIISLLFAWAIPGYSVVGFFKSLASHTDHFYRSIYKTFFVG